MKPRSRFALLLACAAAWTGCAAPDEHAEGAPAQAPMVGSYPTLRGGTLEIFEPAPGHFLIGELIPDHAESPLVADAEQRGRAEGPPDSLLTTYASLVGGKAPPELVAAESRRRAAAPLSSSADAIVDAAETGLDDPLARRELFEKEVDREVDDFRLERCRERNRIPNTDRCQTFQVCLTEKTGNRTITKSGLHGVFTSIRPYRGNVTLEVLYDGSLNFSRTVDEGHRYNAWKTSSRSPFSYEGRVRGAEGDGYHIAVIGTDDVRYYDWYGDDAYAQNRTACSYGSVPPPNSPGSLGPASAGPPRGAPLGPASAGGANAVGGR